MSPPSRSESISSLSPGADTPYIFLQNGLEKISKAKEIKKQPKIKEAVEHTLQTLKAKERPEMKDIQQTLDLICSVKNILFQVMAIDCISKLISYGCLKETRDQVEGILGIVLGCYVRDATDERVQLQILKALVAAISMPNSLIEGTFLRKAVRCCWNIFMETKSVQVLTIAPATLNQIINVVYTKALEKDVIEVDVDLRNDAAVLDASQIFLVLCRLTLKPMEDATNISAINGSSLALRFLLIGLRDYTKLFSKQVKLVNQVESTAMFFEAVKVDLLYAVACSVVSTEEEVYSVALEVFGILVLEFRPFIKRELETTIHALLSVLEHRAPINHKKQIMLMFLQIFKSPSCAVEFYINYDCNPEARDNVYQQTVEVMCKLGEISIPCISQLIQSMQEWVQRNKVEEQVADVERIENSKQKKTLLSEAIHLFNQDPKKGFVSLKEQNICESNDEVACFLLKTQGLSKVAIGEFLGTKQNMEIMKLYMDMLDLSEMSIVEALRRVSSRFKFPGEAQMLDRIILQFANKYYLCNKSEYESADAAYILSFSIMMLNTDLHNAHVKRKITKSEFAKNSNAGDCKFQEEVLNQIYDEIEKNPLTLTKPLNINKSAVAVHKRTREVLVMEFSEIIAGIKEEFDKRSLHTSKWIIATHGEHVRSMVELVSMCVFAFLSKCLQEHSQVDAVLDGFQSLLNISCHFELELRFMLTSQLRKFALPATDLSETNLSCLNLLLDCVVFGDKLGKSWLDVFLIASHMDRFKEKSDLGTQNIVLKTDKLFTVSSKLNGVGIVDFVQALCSVSKMEIPRMYLMTKIVEICYYNMQRIKVEWVKMWDIVGEHFNLVGCHQDAKVACFAVDSLRQLSFKFLEMEEPANFKFQREFMRPFEHIARNNINYSVREMIVFCLQSIVQAKQKTIKSGWKSILQVFKICSEYPNLFTDCFETFKLVAELSDLIIQCNYLKDFLETVNSYAQTKISEKIPLQSVEMISKVQLFCSVESNCLAYLESLLNCIKQCELEARTKALNLMFQTIRQLGPEWSSEFWQKICLDILFHLFDPITKTYDEHMSVWLSTTMTQAMRQFLDCFSLFFLNLRDILQHVFELLESCIFQENDLLVQLGCSCILQLFQTTAKQMNEKELQLFLEFFESLFEKTTANELFDEQIYSLDIQSLIIQKIIIKVKIQALLIDSVSEIVKSNFDFKDCFCLRFIRFLDCSRLFCLKFNMNLDLRQRLLVIGFTEKLPDLFRPEMTASCAMMELYFKLKEFNNEVCLFCTDVLKQYSQCRDYSLYDPVLLSMLNGILSLQNKQKIKQLYFCLCDILCHPINDQIRTKLRHVLIEIN